MNQSKDHSEPHQQPKSRNPFADNPFADDPFDTPADDEQRENHNDMLGNKDTA